MINTDLIPQSKFINNLPTWTEKKLAPVLTLLSHLHVELSIYCDIIFHRHCNKTYDHPTVPIYSTDMSYAEHHKFFILIDMQFFTEVSSSIGYWVNMVMGACTSYLMIIWMNFFKWVAYTFFSYFVPISCKKACHGLSSIWRTNLNKLISITNHTGIITFCMLVQTSLSNAEVESLEVAWIAWAKQNLRTLLLLSPLENEGNLLLSSELTSACVFLSTTIALMKVSKPEMDSNFAMIIDAAAGLVNHEPQPRPPFSLNKLSMQRASLVQRVNELELFGRLIDVELESSYSVSKSQSTLQYTLYYTALFGESWSYT